MHSALLTRTQDRGAVEGLQSRQGLFLCRAKDFVHKLNKMVRNLADTKRLSSKNFQTLLPNFVKGLSESCL